MYFLVLVLVLVYHIYFLACYLWIHIPIGSLCIDAARKMEGMYFVLCVLSSSVNSVGLRFWLLRQSSSFAFLFVLQQRIQM